MEPLTVAKLIAILQRMDRDAPVIVEGEKDAPAAVDGSRTYGVDRKGDHPACMRILWDEVPILRR